jgi:Secretion system C-terminal sorting domain/Domain of unknown function (DUF5122) beta-propeller
MRLLFFILLYCYCSLLTVYSQNQFQIAIGGTGNEYAYSIKRTTDGGYAAAGGTTSFGAGSGDFYIVKIDGSGNLQWTRTIGGAAYEGALFIVQTTDGGYAVAGYTQSFGAGNSDFYIVKLDAGGNFQWNRTIGGANEDVALAIVQTTDGGYAAAGYTYSFGAGDRDFYIVKLDASGNLQWNRTVGGTNYDYGETIIQTTDSGCAVAGFTYSFGAGSGDFYIVKLDASGNLQWNRNIGGTDADYCLSVIQTTDGGYAMAGQVNSFGAGSNDFYIVKLDAGGMLQWTRAVGGAYLDYGESVMQTTDGGYAVGGLTYSFGAGDQDLYLVKLDAAGNFQWNKAVGGTNTDYAESIVQATDGGYVGAGHTNSFGAGDFDMYIVKFDASGNTCADTTSPPGQSVTGGTISSPTPTVTTPSPVVTTPSPTTGTGGTVTTICTFTGIQPFSKEIPESFKLHQNYPNPFNPTTKIKFSVPAVGQRHAFDLRLIVCDILGREIQTLVSEELTPGTYEVNFDGSNLPSGVYYYKLEAEGYAETRKMVLVK